MEKRMAVYWCVLLFSLILMSAACGEEDENLSDGDEDGDAEALLEYDSENDSAAEMDTEAAAEIAEENDIENVAECAWPYEIQLNQIIYFSYAYEGERFGCNATFFSLLDDYSWQMQTCYPEFNFTAYTSGQMTEEEAEALTDEIFEASDGAQTAYDSAGECSDAPRFGLYALFSSGELKLFYQCYENAPEWDFVTFFIEKMRDLAESDSAAATEAAACAGECDSSSPDLPVCVGENYICLCEENNKHLNSCIVHCTQLNKNSMGCKDTEINEAACDCTPSED